VKLKAGARNVEVAFTALRSSNPRAVKFRYRLSENDPDWVDAGSERSARYNQLPPGGHLFECRLASPGESGVRPLRWRSARIHGFARPGGSGVARMVLAASVIGSTAGACTPCAAVTPRCSKSGIASGASGTTRWWRFFRHFAAARTAMAD